MAQTLKRRSARAATTLLMLDSLGVVGFARTIWQALSVGAI